jgi:hypothetical protein
MLRPKLLCKDITETPFFVVDRAGELVPRHSVYYIVPYDSAALQPLEEYLNSDEAGAWLRAHCQRAANGYLPVAESRAQAAAVAGLGCRVRGCASIIRQAQARHERLSSVEQLAEFRRRRELVVPQCHDVRARKRSATIIVL